MSRSTEASCHTLQTTFGFLAEIEPPRAHLVSDHVHDEMCEIADRMGRRGLEAIEGVFRREYGETLGDQATSVIAGELVAKRAEQQRAFLVSLGLACHDWRDEYGPGSWTLTEEWQTHGRICVIGGVRNCTGEFLSVRLDSKAFHRASSVLRAVIHAIGPGNYLKPTAAEWRRIWHGSRKGELGVMTQLQIGYGRRVDDQLLESLALDYPEDTP